MDSTLSEVIEIAKLLAASGYFEGVKDMAQAVAKILAGREIGMGAVASLAGVYIEKGRPCFSANAIAAALKRSGRYNFRVQHLDDKSCSLVFTENGQEVGESTFTMQDAETAELTKGKNAHSWRHYPRNMLFARALTNGCRWYAADVGSGVGLYTPEELGAPVTEDAGVLEASPSLALLAAPEEPKSTAGEAPVDQEPGYRSPSQGQEPGRASSDTTPGQENSCTSDDMQPSALMPVSVPPDQRPTGPVITPGQVRLLATIQRRANVSDDMIHAYLHATYDITSRKQIRQGDLNDVLAWLEERAAIAELEAA
jgi:hypothetical protein